MPRIGRPKSSACPFFPHFANASRESETIEALEAELGSDGKPLGNNGYAFWFKLLEMLRVADGMCIDCRIPANWKILQSRTRLNEDDVRICLSVLCTMGAIDSELWENYAVIWCDKFIDHLQSAGCKSADVKRPVIDGSPAPMNDNGKTVEETNFGPVEIDQGWMQVEKVFAEQIGEMPMGEYMDSLMQYYDAMGADVIEIAIKAVNRRQPNNPKIYLMRVLEKWMKKGITNAVEAQAMVTEFEKKTAEKPEAPRMTEVLDQTKWV